MSGSVTDSGRYQLTGDSVKQDDEFDLAVDSFLSRRPARQFTPEQIDHLTRAGRPWVIRRLAWLVAHGAIEIVECGRFLRAAAAAGCFAFDSHDEAANG